MPEANAAIVCRQCRQRVHDSETGKRCCNEDCELFFRKHGELDQSERTVVRQGGIGHGH